MDLGTVIPGVCVSAQTWYGIGSPSVDDDRERLCEAIEDLADTFYDYQISSIEVIAKGDVALARKIAKDSDLKELIK